MRRPTRSPGWRAYGDADNLAPVSRLRFGDEQTRWNSALMAHVDPKPPPALALAKSQNLILVPRQRFARKRSYFSNTCVYNGIVELC